MILPADSAARKRIPIFTGAIKYFPRALAKVAGISLKGNEQHHPGKPLHWDKSKSTDHLDALVRHLVDSLDPEHDAIEALAQAAWRALAELETRLENVAKRTQPETSADVSPREFKVGDRVLGNGGYAFDPSIGTVAGMIGENLFSVRVDGQGNEWSYFDSELTHVVHHGYEPRRWESAP